MHILITGGAGFIGSHLTKKLITLGHKITLIDNFNDYYSSKLKEDRVKIFLKGLSFKLYRNDICDYPKLEKIFRANKFDKIIHLAAQVGVRYSLANPLSYINNNILGTFNLLELVKKYKIKNFIYASSSSVYGNNKKLPFSELDRTDEPVSLYAATKKSTELLAYTYHHLYKINCLGFRFFTVYGPWGRPDMAYFKFTKNIFAHQAIDIYNHGKMLRNFSYIDDVVNGIASTLTKKFDYEIFNIGYSRPEKLGDFINLLEKYIGRPAIQKKMPMQPGDVFVTAADISKAKKLLNYQPSTNLATGLKKFIDWYQEYYHL